MIPWSRSLRARNASASRATSKCEDTPPSNAALRLATSCSRSSRNHPTGRPVAPDTDATSYEVGYRCPFSIVSSTPASTEDRSARTSTGTPTSSLASAIRCAMMRACCSVASMRLSCHVTSPLCIFTIPGPFCHNNRRCQSPPSTNSGFYLRAKIKPPKRSCHSRKAGSGTIHSRFYSHTAAYELLPILRRPLRVHRLSRISLHYQWLSRVRNARAIRPVAHPLVRDGQRLPTRGKPGFPLRKIDRDISQGHSSLSARLLDFANSRFSSFK